MKDKGMPTAAIRMSICTMTLASGAGYLDMEESGTTTRFIIDHTKTPYNTPVTNLFFDKKDHRG